MIRALALAALLLTACNRQGDDGIEPVPTQTAESANRLMSEAERAAANAAARMDTVPAANIATTNIPTENQQ